MDAKLFRNFQAFVAMEPGASIEVDMFADQYHHGDPTGGQWRRMGFIPVDGEDFSLDIQGSGTLIAVELNERILPGAVVREKMIERIASIEEREGRKVAKKEYAALKDEIAFELLPQSHIRRKLVPIMFVDQYVFIFTTSAKLSDDIMALLYQATDVPQLKLAHIGNAVQNSIGGTLTTLAREGTTNDEGDPTIEYLATDSSAVLKGENKKTIRIKDKDVQDQDIQQLLKQDYTVTQLGIEFWEPATTEATAAFTLNDHLAFSGLKLTGVEGGRERDERDAADKFIATAWITATTAKYIVESVIRLMGGLREASQVGKEPDKPLDDLVRENAEAEHATVEDDDEL